MRPRPSRRGQSGDWLAPKGRLLSAPRPPPPPLYFTDGEFPQQTKALAQVSEPAWQVMSGEGAENGRLWSQADLRANPLSFSL